MGLSHALLSKDNEVPCRQILQNLPCLYLGWHMCLFSIKSVFQINGYSQLFYNQSNAIERFHSISLYCL